MAALLGLGSAGFLLTQPILTRIVQAQSEEAPPSANQAGTAVRPPERISVRALDLSRPPSEEELRAAGGMGGALSPIGPADPAELEEELALELEQVGIPRAAFRNPAEMQEGPAKNAVRAQREKVRRLQAINLSFGQAITERMKGNFRGATQLFRVHLEEFPDSPWAGEAMLRLGFDAQRTGRPAEAQARYQAILEQTADGVDSPAYEVRQKAKANWADLDMMLGRWPEAAAKLRNIIETDNDWRRRTWALAWLREAALHAQPEAMRQAQACGSQALSALLVRLDQPEAAKRVGLVCPPTEAGFSLAEMVEMGRQHGLALRGFRGTPEQLATLPKPLIVHYDVGARSVAAYTVGGYGVESTGITPVSPPDTRSPGALRLVANWWSKTSSSSSAPAASSSAIDWANEEQVFQPTRAGHFLLVLEVDTQTRMVTLLDPLQERRYELTYEELKNEWSGAGLVMVPAQEESRDNLSRTAQSPQMDAVAFNVGVVAVAGGAAIEKAQPAVRQAVSYAPQKVEPVASRVALQSVTLLSKTEMAGIRGGCCCTPTPPGGLGSPDPLGDPGPRPPDCGSPVWQVNPVTMNQYISDTPFWISTPVGPDIEISMAFNSQDGLNHNTSFGNKWSFNYGSYLIENPGGGVIVFMPDGREDVYYPSTTNGSFVSAMGVRNKLTKTGTQRYEMMGQSGDKFVYDIPAGTNSTQPFLVKHEDRWGFSLTFTYDSQVRLVKITDALNKETHLRYTNTAYPRIITRVEGPQGRHASFTYDAAGNLTKVIDIEGNGFNYSYDNDIRVTRLESAQGRWDFAHVVTFYGNQWISGEKITITDPIGASQYYEWDGRNWDFSVGWPIHPPKEPRGRHMDARGNITEWLMEALMEGQTRVTKVMYADGATQSFAYDPMTGKPNTITDGRGYTTHITYNPQGQTTAITDPRGNKTTLEYDTNGLDLLRVKNALNQTVAEFTHVDTAVSQAEGSRGQVSSMTVGTSTTSRSASSTYNSIGAAVGKVATVSDERGTSSFSYNSSGQMESASRDGTQVIALSYDALGRALTSSDPRYGSNELVKTFGYDDLDNVNKISYNDGTSTESQNVCCGQPGAVKDRAGRLTYYDYDEMQRLARVQDSTGRTVQFEYDAAGNLIQALDPAGAVIHWAYDERNRPMRKTYSGGTFEAWSYDENGNLGVYRDARGTLTRYTYDENDNLTFVDYPYAADVSFTYDELDRPVTMTDATGTTTFGYDAEGRLTSENGPWANDTVSYQYNDIGARSQMQINGGSTVSYTYDDWHRLTGITSPAGTFTYAYAGATGNLATLTYPNQLLSLYGFDRFRRLTSTSTRKQDLTNIAAFSYSYTGDGNARNIRKSKTETRGSDPAFTINYSYDSGDRLAGEVAQETPPRIDKSYTYDVLGNRTASSATGTAGTSSSSYTSNPLNQITGASHTDTNNQTSNVWYGYWGGALTDVGIGGTTITKYAYDDMGRLREVLRYDSTTGNPLARSVYVHDGLGRKRISREYTWNGSAWVQSSEKRLVYDGRLAVQERDASNAVTATYTRGIGAGGIGGLLARSVVSGGNTAHYNYHYDGQGSVIAMTDASQDVVAEYSYDAWGNNIGSSGAQAGANPYRFSTHEQLSSGLYDMGARVYSPSLGRFLSRDPVGESVSFNLYEYGYNDPLNWGDPDGAEPITLATVLIVVETGLLIYDTVVLVNTLTDPCATLTEKAVVTSLYAVGVVGLGGGYTTLGKKAANIVTLDASAIRFSQSNVRNSLPEITQKMKANGWQGDPIDVVRIADDTLVAVDNTRLAAASLSNTPVQAIVRSSSEAFPAARAGGNLQGATWGEAVSNRIAGQKPRWRRRYPNGSPFTGVHPSTPGFSP